MTPIEEIAAAQQEYVRLKDLYGLISLNDGYVQLYEASNFRKLVPDNVPIVTERNGEAIELRAEVDGVKLLVLI
jgi:hypothetical protein